MDLPFDNDVIVKVVPRPFPACGSWCTSGKHKCFSPTAVSTKDKDRRSM